MRGGWQGRILRVDLSENRFWNVPVDDYIHAFIGGKGINVKIMYDEVDPGVSPFDPENNICLGPGVLAGTLAPSHSRMKITSMSPHGLLENSGIGGQIAAEIRRAGYDNIIIRGKSDKPVYLHINDGKVELRDARHIWGMDTQESQRAIKEELGNLVKVACIGPAGENGVSFSSIITGKGSAAGRGGFGAIMGSKNLKAIAVEGTNDVPIARPSEFLEACKEINRWFPEGSSFIKMQAKDGHGDKYTLGMLIRAGSIFTGNWEERDAGWDRVGEYEGEEEFYRDHALSQYGCFGCPAHHFHIFSIPGMGTGTTKCAQWNAFSSPVWISDRHVMIKANTLCQQFGLDSTGTGNAVAFLMELYHLGIIREIDTDGIPMRRGSERAIFSAIEKIAMQEGFGKLFKEGVWGAARKIGRRAEEYAVVARGHELELADVRVFKARALAAAITDGSLSHGWTFIDVLWRNAREEMEQVALERYGSREAAVPNSYEKKAESVWDQENRSTAGDLLGTCKWLIPWVVTHRLTTPARLFSLATGLDTTEDDLLEAAKRTLALERAFKVRKGVRRDALPGKLFESTVPDGPYKGERLDREKFEKMLDEYYLLRGWNRDGIPKQETFEKLGLSKEWRNLSTSLQRR